MTGKKDVMSQQRRAVTADSVSYRDLEDFENSVDGIRRAALLSEVGEALAPVAEQNFLLALSALETAQRYIALARLAQVRAIFEGRSLSRR